MGAFGGAILTRALVVRVFATLLVWAVAVLTVPSPAAAIKNGQSIKESPAWAAYVTTVSRFLFTQTSETTCTGTLVADGWVMTAAHCVVAEDANGHPTSTPLPISKFEIVLGRSDLGKTWQGGQWTVDQLRIDPEWNPDRLAGDVALLHLAGPLPRRAVPLPLAPSSFSLPDGASPLSYGYGCTSTSYGKNAISTGDFAHYSCHLSNVLRLTQPRSYRVQRSCTTAPDWCLRRAGASEIQNGDSGGPWVPDDKLKSYVVGITSYNSAPQRTDATAVDWHDHHATRITDPTIHAWIDRTAGIQTGTVGAIYRNAGSGASWLFKRDGLLHSIPDGGTYRCLTASGAPAVSEGAFQLAELPVSNEPAKCTTPAVSAICFAYYTNKSYPAMAPVHCLFEGVPNSTFNTTDAVQLHWSGWGSAIATGTGIEKSNHPGMCGGDPACLTSPMTVRLSRISTEPCSPRRIYTRMSVYAFGFTRSMTLAPSNAPGCAQSRCNRVVSGGGVAGDAVIVNYRHVSCRTARAVAHSFFVGRGTRHLGFRCRINPAVHAGGGQQRCTRGGGRLVVIDFE